MDIVIGDDQVEELDRRAAQPSEIKLILPIYYYYHYIKKIGLFVCFGSSSAIYVMVVQLAFMELHEATLPLEGPKPTYWTLPSAYLLQLW